MTAIIRRMIERNKQTYPKGTRVELEQMRSDPRPIPEGTRGTVLCVDDIGTVHVNWDNGRTLGVILGEDVIRIIADREEAIPSKI